MSKLFLFGIGGTGSRVIRSFTMLLASGVKIKNCEKIIPIIIDPDTENGDLKRTLLALRLYKDVNQGLLKDAAGLFSTEINTLASLGTSENMNLKDSFIMDLRN